MCKNKRFALLILMSSNSECCLNHWQKRLKWKHRLIDIQCWLLKRLINNINAIISYLIRLFLSDKLYWQTNNFLRIRVFLCLKCIFSLTAFAFLTNNTYYKTRQRGKIDSIWVNRKRFIYSNCLNWIFLYFYILYYLMRRIWKPSFISLLLTAN